MVDYFVSLVPVTCQPIRKRLELRWGEMLAAVVSLGLLESRHFVWAIGGS